MNNVPDANGTKASRVKLIRAESIGYYAWDNKPAGTGSSTSEYGSTDWSDSALQEVLNSGAYWNRTSGDCPYGKEGATTSCDFSQSSLIKGLTSDAKNMIISVTWNLGGYSSTSALASNMYTYERGTTVYSGHETTWAGYVALMYPSDYGFAVGGSGRDTCLTSTLNAYNYNDCMRNDWLYSSSVRHWTLSSNTPNSFGVFDVRSSGYLGITGAVDYNGAARPVVYLNTNIKFTGTHTGSSSDPYVLSIS